jgi:hypothetical protein
MAILKPKYGRAQPLKAFGSECIVLLHLLGEMAFPIELHDQPQFQTDEIDDEIFDLVLPAKLQPVDSAVPTVHHIARSASVFALRSLQAQSMSDRSVQKPWRSMGG